MTLVIAGGTGPRRAAASPASGPVLVELFTSQGCSSCPPAERFVGELPARGFGTDKVVALTFHVDYWDHLGWRDPFAGPEMTGRQEWYARSGRVRPAAGRPGIGGLYTPQMIVAGQTHFPGGQTDVALREIALSGTRPPRAGLAVRASAVGQDVRVTVGVMPAGRLDPADDWRLTVALVQKTGRTRVLRGENAGETLDGASIVRALSGRLPLGPRPPGPVTLRRPADLDASRAAVVAFVQSEKTLEIAAVAIVDPAAP